MVCIFLLCTNLEENLATPLVQICRIQRKAPREAGLSGVILSACLIHAIFLSKIFLIFFALGGMKPYIERTHVPLFPCRRRCNAVDGVVVVAAIVIVRLQQLFWPPLVT